MSDDALALLFRTWQSARWDMEVRARMLDKEMADAAQGVSTWPFDLFEDYEQVRARTAAHYAELLKAVRARRAPRS